MNNNKKSNLLLIIVLLGILWTKAATLLSIPFLTLFLYKHTHLSITTIGMIVGFQPLALCFGSSIGGYFSDIFKTHTLMLCSIIMSCFVYFGFYFISKFHSSDIQVIVFALLNLLNGICMAIYSPVSRTMISSIAKTQKENVKFLHLRYLAINIGAAFGPLVGAYVGIAANGKAFLATALLYLVYFAFLVFVLKRFYNLQKLQDPKNKTNFFRAFKKVFQNKAFAGLLISLAIFNISYIQLSSNLAVIISNNITQNVVFFSWMLSLNAVMVVLLQPIIYVAVKNYNQSKIMLIGYCITLLSSLVLIFSPVNMITIILFVIFITIAEIFVFPASSIMVVELISEQHRGTAFGIMDFSNLGNAAGPMLGSIAILCLGKYGFYGLIFALSAICVSVYLHYFSSYERGKNICYTH